MCCGAGVCGAAAGCYAGFLEQFEDRCPLTDVYSNGYRDKTTEKQRHREKKRNSTTKNTKLTKNPQKLLRFPDNREFLVRSLCHHMKNS
jgi:hypothetical protein